MTKTRAVREFFILAVTVLALYHAGRSIYGSVDRQMFLNKQAIALKSGQAQSQEINKELREGLSSYRSSSGIERLARERLNLAGQDEIIVRLGK
jgi:cell division protein FtsB